MILEFYINHNIFYHFHYFLTFVSVEVIRQHILRGEKVLVCAPSNIAVDNLLTKLATSTSVVRLGHPARVNVNLQHLCLGKRIANSISIIDHWGNLNKLECSPAIIFHDANLIILVYATAWSWIMEIMLRAQRVSLL